MCIRWEILIIKTFILWSGFQKFKRYRSLWYFLDNYSWLHIMHSEIKMLQPTLQWFLFFHFCYCYYLRQRCIHVKGLPPAVATLHFFSIRIYTHTYIWGFNHWHLMHRHISTHILKNQPCWISFPQRTGLRATRRLTIFFLQKRYICIFGS